ncbi:hypothetical protein DGG96_07295 [Legionella qingyii]|uniref:Uncharacterized protein n=1 Tax=Legionella qingyii TaxID=2184757 RepID=A0A317U3J9_9GAMM|nr:hypothetical protein [Legionella qingyii]PWY56291.1 hypothetical protein DGG96_07295 [Legionella qingyii]
MGLVYLFLAKLAKRRVQKTYKLSREEVKVVVLMAQHSSRMSERVVQQREVDAIVEEVKLKVDFFSLLNVV